MGELDEMLFLEYDPVLVAKSSVDARLPATVDAEESSSPLQKKPAIKVYDEARPVGMGIFMAAFFIDLTASLQFMHGSIACSF